MKKPLLIVLAIGGALTLCCGGMLVLAPGVEALMSSPNQDPSGEVSPLVGSWINGSASLTTYQNLATGEFAPPSGSGQIFEFHDDGTCAHSAMLQSTVYGCTSWIFTSSDDCTWKLDGAQLTVELEGGVNRSRMCGGEVKESDGKARTLNYTVAFDQGRLQLSADGATFSFTRSQ